MNNSNQEGGPGIGLRRDAKLPLCQHCWELQEVEWIAQGRVAECDALAAPLAGDPTFGFLLPPRPSAPSASLFRPEPSEWWFCT